MTIILLLILLSTPVPVYAHDEQLVWIGLSLIVPFGILIPAYILVRGGSLKTDRERLLVMAFGLVCAALCIAVFVMRGLIW